MANRKILLGASGLLMVALLFFAARPPDYNPDVRKVRQAVLELLKARGVKPADLLNEQTVQRRKDRSQWAFIEQRFRVKADFPWDSFRDALGKRLEPKGFAIPKTVRKRGANGGWVMAAEISRKEAVLYRIVLEGPAPAPAARPAVPSARAVVPGKGKIAIILDDWGYTMKQVPALKSIHQPLTISILPALPHSADVANAAKQSGHQVMLHLPMEAMDPAAPREKRTILTSMSRDEAVQTMDQLLETVPFVVGVNNHQGSKATADPQLMGAILGEAKRRGLFYVDSVTGQSVCAEVARDVRIRFGQRAVFLDNSDNPELIRQQLDLLAAEAAKNGGAIAIGHDRPNTIKVLQQVLPGLEKAGYKLVYASDLTAVSE